MSGFNSSDEENQDFDESELVIDRVAIQCYGCSEEAGLYISALPGCRFKECWRDIKRDIKTIKGYEIEDVFVLCTKGELNKYRVPDLLSLYKDSDITVHHHPILDGQTTTVANILTICEEINRVLKQGKKTLLHCYGGMGRSCLVVAALLMQLDKKLTAQEVIAKMRDLRGKGAVQSVKQYNFVTEFRQALAAHAQTQNTGNDIVANGHAEKNTTEKHETAKPGENNGTQLTTDIDR